jgi:RNA polymerase-binding transcription factor
MEFTDEEAQEMKSILQNLQKETAGRIEQLTESSRPVDVDGSIGRVTRTDAIQQQQTALTGLRRAKELIAFLESALRKLDAGTYGDCVACGGPIAIKRLKAKPDARICMECAREASSGKGPR